LPELELFGRCFPLYTSVHCLQCELIEVEGMDIPDVEGMNMLEEHERPLNQRPEEEGMDIIGIHMVEVEGINMVDDHPSNERSKVEGMNMVDESPMKQRPEVEGMDMVEDTTAEVDVEVVEREHEGVVLVKYWIGNGAERHRRTHWEHEFAKSGC
jgi:hypothetical protein